MSWYSAGTVTATNGSATVTGEGTLFLGNVRVGDGIAVTGSTSLHEVTGVSSDTQLTIAPVYPGTTGGSKTYRVAPVLGYDKDLSDAFNDIRLTWGGQLSALKSWATAATAQQARIDMGAQTSDATLTALAGVTTAADKLIYATGADTFATATLTAQARALLDDVDQAGMRGTLGVVKQTSTTDTTVGALMINGAHGIGANTPPSVSNPNAERVTGVKGGTGTETSNFPDASTPFGPLFTLARNISNLFQFSMFGSSATDARLHIRGSNDTGGTWGAWRNIYHTGNILGTVSQSSGVPTGAIIERGSNANGEYTKYADGTLECWLNLPPSSQACTTAMSGGFRSAGITWVYPAGFVGNAAVVTGAPSDLLSASVAPYSAGIASCAFVFVTVTSQAAAERGARLRAIGRWY